MTVQVGGWGVGQRAVDLRLTGVGTWRKLDAVEGAMKLIIVISIACLAGTLALRADDPECATAPVGSIDPDAKAAAPDEAAEGFPVESGEVESARDDETFVESELLTTQPDLMEREPDEVEGPNEIVFERYILRGAAVQWFKTDNLLQLFNPFAPERYGSGEQNLAYDAITGRPKGMTILAIDFGVKKDRR